MRIHGLIIQLLLKIIDEKRHYCIRTLNNQTAKNIIKEILNANKFLDFISEFVVVENKFYLKNGGVLKVACSHENLRGYKFEGVVIDEWAPVEIENINLLNKEN